MNIRKTAIMTAAAIGFAFALPAGTAHAAQAVTALKVSPFLGDAAPSLVEEVQNRRRFRRRLRRRRRGRRRRRNLAIGAGVLTLGVLGALSATERRRHVDRCYAAYPNSYDPETDTYVNHRGVERRCRL